MLWFVDDGEHWVSDVARPSFLTSTRWQWTWCAERDLFLDHIPRHQLSVCYCKIQQPAHHPYRIGCDVLRIPYKTRFLTPQNPNYTRSPPPLTGYKPLTKGEDFSNVRPPIRFYWNTLGNILDPSYIQRSDVLILFFGTLRNVEYKHRYTTT